MSDDNGSATLKFRSDFFVEVAVIAALAVYLVLARGQRVGDDLGFTVLGAVLMALASYWTLHTFKDGLQLMVLRQRHGK
ncbi:hypothetical protein [Marinobacter sp. C2H3]|uniref:hypothetical protein n=1 Tax=Marinobacter sp. C2H3 TaxID=3119003 RepID=UPI00300F0FAD